tara:strand:+ start:45025 stop:45186 length:162 start_codon:yes stop_codon:yes gene_type:complete
MDRLFRWTIYLIILFLFAVGFYLYSWWSFEPASKKDLASLDKKITINHLNASA